MPRADRIDDFAELLSQDDLTLTQIAERMGIRRPRASQLLMQIRKQLGAQAI